jgi:hypothetical protein
MAKTHVSDIQGWSQLLKSRRPVLTHVNGDTTWLLHLPYPASVAAPRGRSHFNILLDPWLQGPQSDVAWWFSTQWHVVAPSVSTIADLEAALGEAEGEGSRVDAVVVSHEFTDHCHRATLEELPRDTPVYATDVAAELIRGWSHFEKVMTIPALPLGVPWTRLPVPLPEWIGIGAVTTPGDALYYHSALLIAFDVGDGGEAVVYTPHGVRSEDLAVQSCGVRTLALLHGMHDVRIWLTKQLNLGGVNGARAVKTSGAKYWVATHDEVKTGGGLIAPFLQRTLYTAADVDEGKDKKDYVYLELGTGDIVALD